MGYKKINGILAPYNSAIQGINSVIYRNTAGSITNNLWFVKCTQAEYEALTTKDANTFYIIVG